MADPAQRACGLSGVPEPGGLPVVFLYAGQGSQYYQMGRQLYLEHPVFREWMEIGDAILREHAGFSLLPELYGPDRKMGETFDRFEHTHPAIFLTEYALAKVLEHHGLRPDCSVGVSLGEFAAMTAAGALPFERALRTLTRQPEIFHRHSPPGGMLAILADPQLHERNAVLAAESEVAGVNNQSHFVVAAPADALPVIKAEMKRVGVVAHDLGVPYAFHSRWIEPAADACRALFADLRLLPPRRPCFSTSLQRDVAPPETDLYWRIARARMNFKASIEAMEARGGAIYVDLSPSGTLAGLARQLLAPASPSRSYRIASPFGGEMKALDQLLTDLNLRGRGPAVS